MKIGVRAQQPPAEPFSLGPLVGVHIVRLTSFIISRRHFSCGIATAELALQWKSRHTDTAMAKIRKARARAKARASTQIRCSNISLLGCRNRCCATALGLAHIVASLTLIGGYTLSTPTIQKMCNRGHCVQKKRSPSSCSATQMILYVGGWSILAESGRHGGGVITMERFQRAIPTSECQLLCASCSTLPPAASARSANSATSAAKPKTARSAASAQDRADDLP